MSREQFRNVIEEAYWRGFQGGILFGVILAGAMILITELLTK